MIVLAMHDKKITKIKTIITVLCPCHIGNRVLIYPILLSCMDIFTTALSNRIFFEPI